MLVGVLENFLIARAHIAGKTLHGRRFIGEDKIDPFDGGLEGWFDDFAVSFNIASWSGQSASLHFKAGWMISTRPAFNACGTSDGLKKVASIRPVPMAASRSGPVPVGTNSTSLFGSRLNFLNRIRAALCVADPKPLIPNRFPLSCSNRVAVPGRAKTTWSYEFSTDPTSTTSCSCKLAIITLADCHKPWIAAGQCLDRHLPASQKYQLDV